jgi:LysM repeat protein
MICAVMATAQNYPIKIVSGKKYYVYTVQQGEGLYSISKKFSVLQSDIYDANPNSNIDKGLKLGQTLLIPVKNPVQSTEKPQNNSVTIIEHTVVAKQTLFSISKMYGVSQQQINDLNPNIEITKLKIGQIIKVPVSDNQQIKPQTQKVEEPKVEPKPVELKKFIAYEVKKKKETLYGISKEFGVPIDEILAANPFVENGLKVGDILQIPEKDNSVQIVENQENIQNLTVTDATRIIKSESKKSLKIAYLLPFTNNSEQSVNTERFAEFYKGSLLALEEAKANGVSAEVKTFDTGVGNELLGKILSDNFFTNTDIIIGPAYPEQVSAVAAFAKKNKIMQVVPFTSKIDKVDKHEYLYQFNPANEDIFPAVADEFISRFSKQNIIFINFPESNDKGAQFASFLQRNLRLKSIKYQEIQSDNNLASILKENNIIVLATSNIENIASFAPYYKTLNASTAAFWLSDDIAKRFSDLPNTTSYSIFNDNLVLEKYLISYEKWFGTRNAKSTPNYDLIGYDITFYFCFARNSGDTSHFQQSLFKFAPQKNGKGFVNTGFFIVNF